MSLRKIEQLKADKGFKIWDLIVYGVIITVAITLMIILFAVRDTSALKGIRIYVVNNIIYEYDFENDKQVSCKTEFVEVTENNAEIITLKVN
ncbi:MAG: hypothetical protein OSJ68_05690, partial [Clostridia bacterium]|nr:hypothetical protein [Clostridia bacterium]